MEWIACCPQAQFHPPMLFKATGKERNTHPPRQAGRQATGSSSSTTWRMCVFPHHHHHHRHRRRFTFWLSQQQREQSRGEQQQQQVLASRCVCSPSLFLFFCLFRTADDCLPVSCTTARAQDGRFYRDALYLFSSLLIITTPSPSEIEQQRELIDCVLV